MIAGWEPVGDRLSDTDPISNSVMISGLSFVTDAANLIRPGRYPLRCLPAYVHESLHHACFLTPVGTALAASYLRGFRRAYALNHRGEASQVDAWTVLDDVVRTDTALHLMRPLAEGIALFGEFDAHPGDAKSLLRVFRNVAIAFGGAVDGWEELSVGAILDCLLPAVRNEEFMRRRKENLLMQGFSTRNGGYLPGYYFVKNLQGALIRQIKNEKLFDSDFYLNFILHWFYSDYALVEALIDGDRSLNPFSSDTLETRDSIQAVSTAFQRRVTHLLTTVTDQDIEAFDERMSSPGVNSWADVQIGMPPERAREIDARLTDFVDEVIATRDVSDDRDGLAIFVADSLLRRRAYLCVGSFAETIEINEHGRVQLGEAAGDTPFPVMSLGSSKVAGPWKGRGTIDVMRSEASGKIFLVAHREAELVATFAPALDPGAEKDELADLNLSTAFCRDAKILIQSELESALASDESAVFLRSYYQREYERVTEEVYRNWCGALMTVFGPEGQIPEHEGAFLDLCAGDTTFLRILAALGCAARGGMLFEEQIEAVCEAYGVDRSEFSRRLEQIEKSHRLLLLYRVGDATFLAI